MSGMDVLRERIARALWDETQHKQPEGRLARSWDEAPIPSREELIAYADAVIAALGLREVATIAWDGEPSMSGKPHRMSLGVDHDLEKLKRAIVEVGPVKYKPGARIETRYVTPWERIEDDQ